MMIVNKGTSIGWTLDAIESRKDSLGLSLFSVVHYIIESWEADSKSTMKNSKLNDLKDKQRGLIKEASLAMKHDIHGLATQIDMLKFIFNNRKGEIRHKDFLYVSELTEKYFISLRSIYDFIAKLSRLSVDPKHIGSINFDSLNDLIKGIEKGKTKGKLSFEMEEIILSSKDNFDKLRSIRDFIIHNGKQISVATSNDEYLIWNFSKDFTEFENNVPIFQYLSEITNNMFLLAETVGVQIQNDYTQIYGEFPCYYVALEGVCIPTFIDLLGWTKK